MSRKRSPEAEIQMRAEADAFAERWLYSGHRNAVTRDRLVRMSGINDRAVRELLELARDNGALICNDQDGMGYYLAETDDEIDRQYRRDRARALAVLKRLKPYRQALKEAGRPV